MINNKRDNWIDTLRALATFSVILIHVVSPILNKYNQVPEEIWWIGNVYDSMVRFSVPLFFMLSGALLLNIDYKLNDFLKKRALRILPPLIFWSFIYIIYDFYFGKYATNFISLNDSVEIIGNSLLEGSQFHLWFVYTILGVYLFVPIIRKWLKHSNNKEVLYFLIIWVITLFAEIRILKPYFPELYLTNFTGYLGYLVLGYYLTKIEVKSKVMPLLLFLTGLLITILGTYYLTNKGGKFSATFYKYLMPNILISSTGIFLLLKDVSIKYTLLIKPINLISKHSYGIYLVHVLVLYMLNKIGINWSLFNPLFSIPLITILCLIISGIIIKILSLNKFSKYVSG